MTLLRALVSRFSALLGDVYYEGTVPPDAPYPYAVVSAKIPAAFGGTGEWRNEKPVRTQAIPSHGREQSIAITIPPLGAVILRGAGEYKKPKAKKSKAREELPA